MVMSQANVRLLGCTVQKSDAKALDIGAVTFKQGHATVNIRIFERQIGNRSNTPQLNVARSQNPEFVVLSIITSYDFKLSLVNVP
jgi:hypothetical protein